METQMITTAVIQTATKTQMETPMETHTMTQMMMMTTQKIQRMKDQEEGTGNHPHLT